MARAKEIAGKIERIELALARAEQELPADHIFEKQVLMCELIGCSWPTLRDWINDNPALERPDLFTRGGNGVKWQFHVRPFLRALLDIFRKDVEAKTEANAELRRKIGVDLPETEKAATLDETKQLVNLTLTVEAAAKEQGRYTPTEEVVIFMEGFLEAIVAGILGVKTKTDPNGNLPPNVRAAMDDYLRGVAADVHEKGLKFTEEHRARLQQARTGGESVSAFNAPVLSVTG